METTIVPHDLHNLSCNKVYDASLMNKNDGIARIDAAIKEQLCFYKNKQYCVLKQKGLKNNA